ncbi:MAG: hypothetical protein COB10_07555, partial [Planctomycetota bacterium]
MLTRTLLASDSADQWSAQERFAGRGKWDRIAVEKETVRLIDALGIRSYSGIVCETPLTGQNLSSY